MNMNKIIKSKVKYFKEYADIQIIILFNKMHILRLLLKVNYMLTKSINDLEKKTYSNKLSLML